jgi:hypothetical protein
VHQHDFLGQRQHLACSSAAAAADTQNALVWLGLQSAVQHAMLAPKSHMSWQQSTSNVHSEFHT